MYRKAEKPLPDGWALDQDGNPSSDADLVLRNIVAKPAEGSCLWVKMKRSPEVIKDMDTV